jgi:hypothetical protein
MDNEDQVSECVSERRTIQDVRAIARICTVGCVDRSSEVRGAVYCRIVRSLVHLVEGRGLSTWWV